MSNRPFFDYDLANPTPPDKSRDKDKKDDDKKPLKPPGKEGPIRTQMVGESPDDDLGYDPRKIPVEDIPDED